MPNIREGMDREKWDYSAARGRGTARGRGRGRGRYKGTGTVKVKGRNRLVLHFNLFCASQPACHAK